MGSVVVGGFGVPVCFAVKEILGDTGSPASYIETVARKGYRLVAWCAGPKRPPRRQPKPA